jgi:hypothetical protein
MAASPAPAFLRMPAWLDAAPAPAELAVELASRRNALEHLRRSQGELRAALRDAPGDADFDAALAENELVLVRQAGRLAELEALAAAAAAAEAQGRQLVWVPPGAWGAGDDGAGRAGEGPEAAAAAARAQPPRAGGEAAAASAASARGARPPSSDGGGGDPGMAL